VVKKFKQKWDDKEFIKSIISKMSMSWFSADGHSKDGYKDLAKKVCFIQLESLCLQNN
jgi:hypothetical protein